MFLEILLHDILLTAGATDKPMQAPLLRIQIHLPRLLLARLGRTIHQSIIAVLPDMSLEMAPRHDLGTAVTGERAFHADVVTHVYQETRHVHEGVIGGRAAARTLEVIAAGT